MPVQSAAEDTGALRRLYQAGRVHDRVAKHQAAVSDADCSRCRLPGASGTYEWLAWREMTMLQNVQFRWFDTVSVCDFSR